jgi:tripartite-type tricarboxylate transporter receptor subunit TctC
VGKLNGDIVAILRQPEVRDRLSKEGADLVGSTPPELAAYMKSEIEKWSKVVKAARIQAH